MRCDKHPNSWIGTNGPGYCPVCASESEANSPSDAAACSAPVLHAEGEQEHALCGLAFDAYETGDEDNPVIFAKK